MVLSLLIAIIAFLYWFHSNLYCGVLGGFGAILRGSWAALGDSWALLEGSWRPVDTSVYVYSCFFAFSFVADVR